ncbi:hypothetical protein PVK06_024857 [Gossypium arboreum]|uniref:Uncharacterized protein n=1 Tax=Gossypium arboreum TaxID=29729 RepID=A0ABR0PF08_GOSAR|nr:hypothetical protein PVK06_024857 [Gossypium arboreum]
MSSVLDSKLSKGYKTYKRRNLEGIRSEDKRSVEPDSPSKTSFKEQVFRRFSKKLAKRTEIISIGEQILRWETNYGVFPEKNDKHIDVSG